MHKFPYASWIGGVHFMRTFHHHLGWCDSAFPLHIPWPSLGKLSTPQIIQSSPSTWWLTPRHLSIAASCKFNAALKLPGLEEMAVDLMLADSRIVRIASSRNGEGLILSSSCPWRIHGTIFYTWLHGWFFMGSISRYKYSKKSHGGDISSSWRCNVTLSLGFIGLLKGGGNWNLVHFLRELSGSWLKKHKETITQTLNETGVFTSIYLHLHPKLPKFR